MSTSLLDGLNEQQRIAVTAPDGPVLVLAGPGSGKTRVLAHRIAWLVRERGVPPWHIVAMTFTNKAAREMRQRVERLLEDKVQGIRLGTFHAVCARILRDQADHLPITRDYVIFDAPDQRALIRSVIADDLGLDEKRYPPERILAAISQAKNDLITPQDYQPTTYFEEITKRAYQRYQERLLANNAVDFDDLLMYTALLFAQQPRVLKAYHRLIDHILVDEFQDTNGAQYALLKQLAEARRNLFCVGDEDQSIYRWRGADYRNLARLRADFPDLFTVLLEQNYRSTQVILDAAQAVIDKNPYRTPKRLFTQRQGGPAIVVYEAYDEEREAQFVVDTIAALVAQGEVEPRECAVMYRTNAQSRTLEDAFVRANLPYRLVGATRFYARREIKDIIAYLRLIHNPEDAVSLRRVINTPPRGIGEKTLEELEKWAQGQGLSLGAALLRLSEEEGKGVLEARAHRALAAFARRLEGWRKVSAHLSVGTLLKMVLDETGYLDYLNDGTEQGEERIANVRELVNVTAEYEDVPLSAFLEEVALVSDVDGMDETVNAPSLMTLHTAKGLEFDVVFLVGLEEGLLPHQRSFDDPEEMAEERRLMYVGMTRARRRLYLVYAFRRRAWGESAITQRSRFIDDIPPSLLVSGAGLTERGYATPPRTRVAQPPRWTERSDPAPAPRRSFKTGQRVVHPQFGSGLVIEVRPSGNDEEIRVAFDHAGVKRLLGSYADLKSLEDG